MRDMSQTGTRYHSALTTTTSALVTMLAASFCSVRARYGSLSSLATRRASQLQHVRLGGFTCRAVSTAAPDPTHQKRKTTTLDRVVNKLNDSIQKYPGETISVLFTSDILSIGAMYGAISMVGIEFSPEFALAFATSRPFRRFRLPLDLVVAAGVAKAFPVFSRVRLSDLSRALPKYVQCCALNKRLYGMRFAICSERH